MMMAKDRAYTLLELVIAFALLTIILVSFYPIIISTSNINAMAQENLNVEIIAQNEIEELIHYAKSTSSKQFTSNLVEYQENLNRHYQDQDYTFAIYFSDVNSNSDPLVKSKSLQFKISSEDKVIYETETWLQYEQ